MEYQKAHKEIVKLLKETLPEDFDTGDWLWKKVH
jgi:hypothetical protein